MRQYTLLFMEQRIGVLQLRPLDGAAGAASFLAADDEAALAHSEKHFLERLVGCVRGELSSLAVIPDPAGNAPPKFVDDSHANPQFQETYVKYDAATKAIVVDFESTRTAATLDLRVFRAVPLRPV